MFANFILPCLLVASASAALRTWDYSFILLDVDIKVDYVSSDLKAERITRGDYAADGHFTLLKDIGPKYKVSYLERLSISHSKNNLRSF